MYSGQSILILWAILQVPPHEIADQRYECRKAFPAVTNHTYGDEEMVFV